ncbi:MAG TPA: hypothetical protein VMT10_09485 [Solirubrobacteraceae bacterium]|nr:hypothetical protein [Solirubrobacteraceae bacterium]
MSTQDIHAPTLGAAGEPCATCGALLAADQRYCLNCGARRTDARLAFKEILASNGTAVLSAEGTAGDYGLAPAGGATPASPPAGEPRSSGNRPALAALAGIGCLLLAMGVGVLIGNAGSSKTTTAPAPQVISVGGAAAGTAAGTTTGTTATTPSSSSGSSSSGSSGGGSSSKSGASTSSGATKATNKNLQNLQKLSPKAYQKQSSKLPKVVGTGGKPPPKDNKAPAGGGSFQTIG